MERLTLEEAIVHAKEVAEKNYRGADFESIDSIDDDIKTNCIKCAEEHMQLVKWLEELKSYKDLEEQGLLVRLPCKLKNKLYHFYGIDLEDNFADATSDEIIMEVVVTEFIIDSYEITIKCITDWNSPYEYLPAAEFDKTVFLTHEEAEKKLEEMKNNGSKK